jgi:hypothetical protein
MLESPSLLLLPAAAETPDGQRQTILDAPTKAPVGFVYRRPVTGPRWLVRWFRPPPVLEVHEAEDEPLLFTVRCLWPWVSRWEVCDADGHVLGRLRRCRQYDPDPKAYRMLPEPARTQFPWMGSTVAEDGAGRRALVPDGWQGEWAVSWIGEPPRNPLATLGHAGEGVRITFGCGAEGNPFAKMLLLAALLVTQP